MTTPKQSKKAYSEKTNLGGPIPIVMGTGRMACRVKLSSAVLGAADLLAGQAVEILASPGEITIRSIATPEQPPEQPQTRTRSPRERQMDDIMEQSRRREKGLPQAGEEPLSDAQLDGEAL